jgi:hypothetical protein
MPPKSPLERAGFALLVEVAASQRIEPTKLLAKLFDEGVEIHLPAVGREISLRIWREEPAEDWEISDAILEYREGPDREEVTPESLQAYERAAEAGVMLVEDEESVASVVLREEDLFILMRDMSPVPQVVRRPGSQKDERLLRCTEAISIRDVAVHIKDIPAVSSARSPYTLPWRSQHGRARFVGVLCLGLVPQPTKGGDLRGAAAVALSAAEVTLSIADLRYALGALRRDPEGGVERDLPEAALLPLVRANVARRPKLTKPNGSVNVGGLAQVLVDAQHSIGVAALSESRLRNQLTIVLKQAK